MSYNIKMSSYFEHEAKRLAKHYPSFKNDYLEFLKSIEETHIKEMILEMACGKLECLLPQKEKESPEELAS